MLSHESCGFIQASVDKVFAYIDDHTRLSAHMSKPSWKTGWSRINTELDESRGHTVGSRIRLAGRILGIRISVEELVTERVPPHHKVWKTTGVPKLLVIGPYRMGFELSRQGKGSMLRVFIDYALPEKAPQRWLGCLFSRSYAKWCTQQMIKDTAKHFESRLT